MQIYGWLMASVVMAGCGGGGGGGGGTPPPPPPPPPPTSVTISGTVQYEIPPPNNNCAGLNFGNIQLMPIRGATVQLLRDSDSSVLGTTVADDSGNYSFAGIDTSTNVRLRVRAELKRTGGLPNWDVEIRDNVDTGGSPPPLGQRPLYAIDFPVFSSGTANNSNRNFTAATGWNNATNQYDSDRAAAPFAILDAVYSAMQLIVSVDGTANFAPLDAFWSPNNTLADSTDIDAGELGSSFYRGDIDSLFLLGDADVDTEEFDDHVVVHEWGHYFEDNFSRSDSVGGPHSIGDQLDMRLAFGEGWATALAGIALNNHLYCDTGPAGSTSGFGIGAESGSYDAQGWYDEISVVRFIYDLWDTNDEGGDTGSIGFQPIYDTMTGPQRTATAHTSVFSFASELRTMLAAGDQTFLDSQLVREDMTPGFDSFGAGELNDAGSGQDVFPLYQSLPTDGTVVNVCVNTDYDTSPANGTSGNKLAQYRFFTITPASSGFYRIDMTTTTAMPSGVLSDPDFYLQLDGQLVAAVTNPPANSDSGVTQSQLQAGQTYVGEIQEWRYTDPDIEANFPTRVCFDLSMQPN